MKREFSTRVVIHVEAFGPSLGIVWIVKIKLIEPRNGSVRIGIIRSSKPSHLDGATSKSRQSAHAVKFGKRRRRVVNDRTDHFTTWEEEESGFNRFAAPGVLLDSIGLHV